MNIDEISKTLEVIKEKYKHTALDIQSINTEGDDTLKITLKGGLVIEKEIERINICTVCKKPVYIGAGIVVTHEDGRLSHLRCTRTEL